MIRFFRTLRFRLAALCASVLALVLLASGATLYGTVRYQLLRHHDGDLREAALAVQGVLAEEEDCARLTAVQKAKLDRIGHLVLFHAVEEQHRVFYRSPDSGLSGSAELGPAIADLVDAGFTTIPAGRVPVRTFSQPYRARSGRRGVIHVAESLGDVVAPLESLRLALLPMAPVAILASALGGYWLAGRALAPVDEATRLAREIGASSLGRRLPSPGGADEFGRLVETLNEMIARLEAAFEAMRRLTADASHELRGPLANMRGAIDVALARPRDEEEYRRVLGSVGEDVDRLRSIVDDLLVLARADAGRMRLERSPVRLDVVAAEVVESFVPAASGQGVTVSADCRTPATVLGDERWLRQLVSNLIDNAVKFSAAARSRSVLVEVEVTVERGRAVLRILDTGPGIPDHALGHIFERFYRADSARTHHGTDGCGLGLAIAAWIAEAHGGEISARNRDEGGSVFAVALPLVLPARS